MLRSLRATTALALLVGLAACDSQNGAAGPPPLADRSGPATLAGAVFAGAATTPLPGAKLWVVGEADTVYTERDGSYSLSVWADSTGQTFALSATADGYEPLQVVVPAAVGEAVPVPDLVLVNPVLERVTGEYALSEVVFDPDTQALAPAEVSSRLDAASSAFRVFGDGSAELSVRFADGAAQRVGLRVSALLSSATFNAEGDRDGDLLAALLLPPTFTLRYEGDRARVLEGSLALSGVDLEAFDPEAYRDQTSVRGTLTVRLDRR
jgi:hypothetical protein